MAPYAADPLRLCLLSGGESARMGRDKALLRHPGGGTWLERMVGLLLERRSPLTLMTRHRHHLELTRALIRTRPQPCRVDLVEEDPPWEGPLLALDRLMASYPNERLLLCPVDMPWLSGAVIDELLERATGHPERIHVAHDGRRLQPMLGVYPSDAPHRCSLRSFTAAGGRAVKGWLEDLRVEEVRLDPHALRNVNRPGEWSAAAGAEPAHGG
jgi:molybdopterin-guanine dinucleotide biosynthesis protein A